MQKARRKRARLTRVLVREGTDDQNLGQIYLAVVQSILLYGPEMWVMTPRIRMVFVQVPPQCGPQANW